MKNSPRNILSYIAVTALVVGTMAGGRAQIADTRIGSLSFERGLPTEDAVTKLFDALDFQRACQAYVWALPIVGITRHSAPAIATSSPIKHIVTNWAY